MLDAMVVNQESIELREAMAELREQAIAKLAAKIIAVVHWKGGVGKTMLSLELAYMLAAVLVDFDWEDGNASRAMGYLAEKFVHKPLVEALESGKTPTPRRQSRRPDLVPADPTFQANQPTPDQGKDALVRWAMEWQRPVVVDTHPGGCDATFAAIGAADLLVVPVELETRALEALSGLLRDLTGYNLLLIPNAVPNRNVRRHIEWMARLAQEADVPIGPPISEYSWLRQRVLHTVVTAASKFGTRTTLPLATDLVTVGEKVLEHAC